MQNNTSCFWLKLKAIQCFIHCWTRLLNFCKKYHNHVSGALGIRVWSNLHLWQAGRDLLKVYENKLDKLRAKIVTQQEIRECCGLIFTETWLSEKVPEHAFSYRLTPYTEETRLQPPVRPKGDVCLSKTCGVEIWGLFMSTAHQMWSFYCWNAVHTITAVFLAAVYILQPRDKPTAVLSKLHEF